MSLKSFARKKIVFCFFLVFLIFVEALLEAYPFPYSYLIFFLGLSSLCERRGREGGWVGVGEGVEGRDI